MQQELPRLTVSAEGDVTIVELTDRKILDEISISQIGERLQGLVAKSANPKFILDFSSVAHMSSSALGMLITLHKRIREKNGQLRLSGIQAADLRGLRHHPAQRDLPISAGRKRKHSPP